MVYKIGICDNEELQIKINMLYVKEIALKHGFNFSIETFISGTRLNEYLSSDFLDVIFLDIQLENESGIDIAKEIKLKYPNIIIVFITGHREFANEAFDVEAMGYVLKPIEICKVEQLLIKILKFVNLINLNGNSHGFKIKINNTRKWLPFSCIIYLKKINTQSLVVTKNSSLETYESLDSLMNKLSNNFIRITQSLIININEVKHVKKNIVTLKNNIEYKIGRAYYKNFLTNYPKLFDWI